MTARPVVLAVIKGLGIGGAETLLAEGSRFWDKERFAYHVAYVLPWKEQLAGRIEAQGVPVHCVGRRGGLTPAAVGRLRRLARTIRADLLHVHSPAVAVGARLAVPGPIVYTEHNLVGSYRRITRVLNRITYGRNLAVIAVSGPVAGSLHGYPGPPPRVIPNGVAVTVSPGEARTARRELGIGPQIPLVVHVGNIRPHKGHTTLIGAVTELKARLPRVAVVSIGGEKHRGDLERVRDEAARAGLGTTLRFLGRRPDARAFIAAADVFVSASDVEGLPLSVLEAAWLARPIVATAAGGVPDVVRDRETGLLVRPGDTAGLAEGIVRLLSHRALAGQLADKARGVAEREHGLEPMVRRVEGVYREVLGV